MKSFIIPIIILFLAIGSAVSAEEIFIPEIEPGSFAFSIEPLNSAHFKATLWTNTDKQAINIVYIKLGYATTSMELTDIQTASPACGLLLYDENNPENGEYDLICGTPNPGVSGRFKIASFVFEITDSGQGYLEVRDGALFTNSLIPENIIKGLPRQELYFN